MSTATDSTTLPPTGSTASRWAAPALLAAIVVVMFFGAGRRMVADWMRVNSYYSHGPLIPLVSLFFLYRMRDALSSCACRPTMRGLFLLVPSLLAHLLATSWQVSFLSGFAMIGVIAGLVLTLFGPGMLRLTMFPIGFLVFMIPLPDVLVEKISFNLKLLSARGAISAVDALGLVAIREGSYIRIPGGTLIVDDVCSGLKYLISLVAFAGLYAHISSVRAWQKPMLFLLAIPVALVANAARVTLMVLVAYRWGVGASEAWYFHDLFGFALFAVAFLLMFAFESLLLMDVRRRRRATESAPAEEAENRVAPAPAALAKRPSASLLWALGIALIIVAGIVAYLDRPVSTAPQSLRLAAIPLEMGEWRGRDITLEDRVYEILGTRDVLSRQYVNEKGQRVLFVTVLAQQTRRRTHPPEQCFIGEGYRIEASEAREAAVCSLNERASVPVRELVLAQSSGRRVAWYLFKSGPRLTTSYWRHQAGVAMSKLHNRDAADAMVRIDVDLRGNDVEEGRKLLQEFMERVAPHVMSVVP